MTGDLTGKVTTVVDMADYLALEAERDEARAELDEAHRCLAIAEDALTAMADVERERDRLRALLRAVRQVPARLTEPDMLAEIDAALEGRDA